MKKKRTHSGLPPYTYQTASAFVYKPYVLGSGRKGRRETIPLRNPAGKILRPGVPLSQVWTAWERLQGIQQLTIGWLLDAFSQSIDFADLSPITRQEFTRQIKYIRHYPLGDHRAFGDLRLKSITPGMLRKYLDQRKEEDAPISGNRELTLISKAWTWAYGRDEIRVENPCPHVKRNKEVPRKRYVTDEEYAVAFDLAGDYRYLQPAMELAFLCRLRQCEVRELRKSDITEKGLDCRRVKGSRDALTLWSDRLRSAIDMACTIAREVDSVYLLHKGDGQPLTKTGFDTAWQRLKARMRKARIEPFNFHDLKAKGISDFAGDKQAAGGHRTAAMVAIYDRKKPEVDPTR